MSSTECSSLKSLKQTEHPYIATISNSDNNNKCNSNLKKKKELRFKIIFEEGDNIKESSNLSDFHKELTNHEETMIERYGWIPKYELRMASDHNAAILGFAVTNNDEIAGIISMLPINNEKLKELKGLNDDNNNNDNIANINSYLDELFQDDQDNEEDEKYDENYEIAMIVLPKYQRCGIGTTLTKETWKKFGNSRIQCIAIVQSQKSEKFIKKMQQSMNDFPVIIVNPRNC